MLKEYGRLGLNTYNCWQYWPECKDLSNFCRCQSPGQRSRVRTPVIQDLSDSLQVQDRCHLWQASKLVANCPRRHRSEVADQRTQFLVVLETTQLCMVHNTQSDHPHRTDYWDNHNSLQLRGWLGSIVVGCRTSDRKIASSTPGRCIAG